MSEVLIVQHESHEGPGYFEDILQEAAVDYHTHLSERGSIPFPNDFDAMLVMGGSNSVNENTEIMRREIEAVQDAVKAKVAVLGVCLGHQVLAKAMGGNIVKSWPRPEIGFRDQDGKFFEMHLSQAASEDPLFKGISSPVPVLHLHSEMVQLTDDMTLLATGQNCFVQAARMAEKAWGIQGHIEVNDDLFEQWLEVDPNLKKMDEQALWDDYKEMTPVYRETSRKLFTNFLRIAGLLN